MHNPCILITGAAGAIGEALALALAERDPGGRFALWDIDEAGAERVAARLDVARREASRVDLSLPASLDAAHDALVERVGPVDILINCAGIMDVRTLEATPWAAAQRLLDVDLISPLKLMSLVTPGMRQRRQGCIINISSMAGVTPIRGCAYYGAAKAGLAMASEIARRELASEGVDVITVYPGPVRSALEAGARAQVPPSLLTKILPMGDPESLARLILKACREGRPRVVYPSLYAFAFRARTLASAFTTRFSPAPLE